MSTDTAVGQREAGVLYISMLGRFGVELNGVVLSEESRRQQKIWTLFKYLVTNRKRRVPASELIGVLWDDDEECENEHKALQNLIYRLRHIISAGVKESLILYTQDCYYINPNARYELDADHMERLNQDAAARERAGDFEGAAALYMRAHAIYGGDYLAETASLIWVLPVANYYKRLYTGVTLRLIRAFRELGRPEDIIRVCERAFEIEPFEEALHVAFLNALADTGNIKQARSHYEWFTAMLYGEYGVKPSQTLKEAYKRIHEDTGAVSMDLDTLQELLSEGGDTSDAFLCDAELFRALYKLEARRVARTGQVVFLALLTLIGVNFQTPELAALRPAMDALGDLLLHSLRRGDVVARWNDAQYIVMLASLTHEDGEVVISRVQHKFAAQFDAKHISVKYKLQPVNALL